MDIVTLDFETFYDTGYGLNRLTTEEYIKDERFQVIGVGLKINHEPIQWLTGEELVSKGLSAIDWKNSMLLCHNTQFDGAILKWHFGIEPAKYLDTLSMARALHGVDAGGSLKALAEHYKLGEKGTEVLNAKGKRLEDFQDWELRQYGVYCKNDVKLTYDLFKIISKGFPPEELRLIDLTLKMFILPVLKLDSTLLETRLSEVRDEKQQLLNNLQTKLNCQTEEEVRKILASNKQFAELLENMGVDVPMKLSATTGKETYALAKGDEEFLQLCEHENTLVQELCAVRLGTKSTIEESRIERFLEIAKRHNGYLPIPLKYYGAHTGRWAGSDKVNFQNLPARDAKKKALKNAILPPKDHVIINADSSQIEARVLVWLAGQHDVLTQFANGEDVYVNFARRVYGKSDITKTERAVGKTCILGLGYGTGAKKLQNVLKINAGQTSTERECQRLVTLYREVNHEVVKLWHDCDRALADIASWPEDKNPYYLDKRHTILVTHIGLRLPNGLFIYYPELELKNGKYTYKSRRGRVGIWGGAVVENVVQALARIVIGQQMLEIDKEYRPVLTVHDAIVCVAHKDKAKEALDFILEKMNQAPLWAKGLPVTCEGGFANNYGDC